MVFWGVGEQKGEGDILHRDERLRSEGLQFLGLGVSGGLGWVWESTGDVPEWGRGGAGGNVPTPNS